MGEARRAAWPCAKDISGSLLDDDSRVFRAVARALGFLGESAAMHAGTLPDLDQASVLRAEAAAMREEARLATATGHRMEAATLRVCNSSLFHCPTSPSALRDGEELQPRERVKPRK